MTQQPPESPQFDSQPSPANARPKPGRPARPLAAGWYEDPGRTAERLYYEAPNWLPELRYHDGTRWTQHISTRGITSIDSQRFDEPPRDTHPSWGWLLLPGWWLILYVIAEVRDRRAIRAWRVRMGRTAKRPWIESRRP
jgi:Protein of unknown function (DUF2510)